MKYSDFEKHIGKELGGAKEAVDINQLLEGLNLGDSPRESKVRPFLFWLLIPMILIGSYATFVAMDGNNSFSLNQKTDNKLQSDNEGIQKAEKVNEVLINSEIEENQILLNKETISTANQFVDKSNAINPKSQSEINSQIKTTNQLKDNNNSNLNKATHSYPLSNEGKPSVAKPIVTEGFFSISSQTEQPISVKNTLKRTLAEENNNEQSYYKSTLLNDSNLKSRSNLNFLPISNRSINVTGLDIETDDLFSRMKINCPSFNQAHWRLALVPEVGLFAPFKTLGNKKAENLQAFEERLMWEETLEGINIGLYSMLVRDKLPIYLKAGISYSRISERTDLEYNYTKLDTTIGVISQTVSANGDSITTIMGPIISEKTFAGKNRQHNYIHLFDLPVSIGYNTYVGGFDLGIEAGVKINLMTRATGNLLISKSDYSNLSLNEYYKKKIGLSYFGGIMIGRNFGRFGDFYLAPRFTYYPSDFSNAANNISQKYVTMGMNVGYVYKLK